LEFLVEPARKLLASSDFFEFERLAQRRNGKVSNRLRQFTECLRRDGNVPHAARFQILQVLNGCVKQLAVSIGHGARITCPGAAARDFSGASAPCPPVKLELLPESLTCNPRILTYRVPLDLWN